VYVVAPLADITVEFPEQIVVAPDAIIVGDGFTVTTTVCCALVQPPVVPVTVYVVVEPGETLTVDVVAPTAGDHEYVVAPFADSTVEFPEQIVGGGEVMFTVGVGFTDTTNV